MLDLAMLDGSLEILFYIACLLGLGLCAVLDLKPDDFIEQED